MSVKELLISRLDLIHCLLAAFIPRWSIIWPLVMAFLSIIYRQKSFPVFSAFDSIMNTASKEFSLKLIKNTNVGFAFDVNYLFDPKNLNLVNELINMRTMVLPTVSHNISNYAEILKSADFFMEKIGKKEYYQLCSQIRRCASKFDC